MIYSKHSRRTSVPGGFFHLEEEKTKTRVFGYGHGDYIKLKDEYGNEWIGSATLNADESVAYRFRNGKGKSLSGVSESSVVTLRDEQGNTWKGFVD